MKNSIQNTDIVCDKKGCGYKAATNIKLAWQFVNKPCPKCGSILLTEKDHKSALLLVKVIESPLTKFISKVLTTLRLSKLQKTNITSDTNGNLSFQPVAPSPLDSIKFDPSVNLYDVERRYVESALDYYDGNRTQAANALGITIKNLYDKTNGYENFDNQMKGSK